MMHCGNGYVENLWMC